MAPIHNVANFLHIILIKRSIMQVLTAQSMILHSLRAKCTEACKNIREIEPFLIKNPKNLSDLYN